VITEHRFLFIGGLHRSGTSIIFKCLRDHPQASGFKDTGVPEDEGQFLQSVYQPAKAYGGVGRFCFNAAAHLDENSPLVTQENAARIFAEWGAYWDLSRPLLLEKSPPNLIRTRFLQALFPDALFVIMLRHPLATSFSTKKWQRTIPFHRLLQHWLACHRRFDEDRQHLRNLLVVKHEEFIAQPDTVLAKIVAKLGLDDVPLSRSVRPDVNLPYYADWEKMRSSFLGRQYANYMISRLEADFNYFGYSLVDPHSLGPY
jgi:hypothetical protein